MLLEGKVAVIYGAGGSIGGVPESISDNFAGRNEIAVGILMATVLNRAATLADVGNVAAFVVSDQARTMTATNVNISCGAIMD
jgi:3-oxoacyl-[acyl-carrier protein] reductase